MVPFEKWAEYPKGIAFRLYTFGGLAIVLSIFKSETKVVYDSIDFGLRIYHLVGIAFFVVLHAVLASLFVGWIIRTGRARNDFLNKIQENIEEQQDVLLIAGQSSTMDSDLKLVRKQLKKSAKLLSDTLPSEDKRNRLELLISSIAKRVTSGDTRLGNGWELYEQHLASLKRQERRLEFFVAVFYWFVPIVFGVCSLLVSNSSAFRLVSDVVKSLTAVNL
jgi:uncharacterized membrane protein YqjE